MQIRQIDSVLFKMLYILVAGIILSDVLSFSSLTSVLLTLTFPLTVALWARSVRKTLTGLDFLALITISLAFINVLINASLTNTPLTFDYLKKVIMFAMTVLFFQTAYRFRVNYSFINFVNALVDIITVFLIAMYFLQSENMHKIGGITTTYLTFGFSNPNLAGLFLVTLFMLELYRLFVKARWTKKLWQITLAGFLALFIIETKSRNSLLVLILFTAVCVYLMFRQKKEFRIYRHVAAIISSFPAFFAIAYMTIIQVDFIQMIFAFLTGEGKELSSREKIWLKAFENIKNSPIVGAYSQVSEGVGATQLHNTHLDIAASYGMIVLVLVCIILWRYFYQNGKVYKDKNSAIYILGFACAIMLGIGEAALYSGGLGIHVLVGTFLLFSNAEENKTA